MATVLSQRNPHPPLENRFPTYRHSGTFPPSCFHGLRAVAPSRLSTVARRRRGSTCFHGLRAVAPSRSRSARASMSFHGLRAVAPLKRDDPELGNTAQSDCFHGLRAVAPLKPARVKGDGPHLPRFHGLR